MTLSGHAADATAHFIYRAFNGMANSYILITFPCLSNDFLFGIFRWAKDSIFFQTEAAAERLSPNEVVDPRKFCWCWYGIDLFSLLQSANPVLILFSPKCRAEYPQPSIPTCYFCYCGKVANPAFDPWLVPHSCGATCGKLLKSCSHSCLLLCHPGKNDLLTIFLYFC